MIVLLTIGTVLFCGAPLGAVLLGGVLFAGCSESATRRRVVESLAALDYFTVTIVWLLGEGYEPSGNYSLRRASFALLVLGIAWPSAVALMLRLRLPGWLPATGVWKQRLLCLVALLGLVIPFVRHREFGARLPLAVWMPLFGALVFDIMVLGRLFLAARPECVVGRNAGEAQR